MDSVGCCTRMRGCSYMLTVYISRPEVVAAHAMDPPIGFAVELVLGTHVQRGGSPRSADRVDEKI